jgi:glucose/arabinose dehydrogenase
LAFGPDGYLYIGLGDGGAAGDPEGNAQNLSTYLGKMLRLDVDAPEARPEIWASGLRNPWRFSFDPLTGDLYIADVGQNAWEEINFVPAGTAGGLNFGWDFFEGLHPYEGQPPDGIPFTDPVAEYSHNEGCSITGGYVYRGAELPEWQGVYFYSDYCTGNVSGLIRTDAETWQSAILFSIGSSVSTFGVDETGELYLADFGSGSILRLVRR